MSDHTIPTPISPEVLSQAVTPQPEHEAYQIRQYMELEASDEKVIHLELVKSEAIYGDRMDVWDVHTDRGRWWVITNPTNLYSQEHFPSLDYTLSFHVGLMARMASRYRGGGDGRRERVSAAWRRYEQAREALGLADEAEEFQAIGLRCREALLAFVNAAQNPTMLPLGETPPKAGDFVRWAELIADSVAHGASAAEIRGFMKAVARPTWRLVGWLAHAQNAVRHDAEICLQATETVLATFTHALMRHESGVPERCPKCTSYRVASVYKPDLGIEPPYVRVCANCGWTDPDIEIDFC